MANATLRYQEYG